METIGNIPPAERPGPAPRSKNGDRSAFVIAVAMDRLNQLDELLLRTGMRQHRSVMRVIRIPGNRPYPVSQKNVTCKDIVGSLGDRHVLRPIPLAKPQADEQTIAVYGEISPTRIVIAQVIRQQHLRTILTAHYLPPFAKAS